MSLIEVHNVTKTYPGAGEDVTPLSDLSITIEEGEFVALMGPSGSGKTTLLNLLAGIDRPTAGRVVVAGEEVSSLGPRALARWRTRNVGFVFQAYNLIPVLTAYENVEIPLLLLHLPRATREKKILVALNAVSLRDRAHHLPRQMSGGQQQRVAIARAIASNPAIVLADEPTANVDSETAEMLLEIMENLNRERSVTFLFSTHDPRVMDRARRVVRIVDGQVERDDVRP